MSVIKLRKVIRKMIFETSSQAENSFVDINSPEFKAWFGNSKIIDKNGNPLIVYHGTKDKFDGFEKDYMGKNFSFRFGKGFYFTEIKENTTYYGNNLLSAYLSIKNPLIVSSDKEYKDAIEKGKEKIISDIKQKEGLKTDVVARDRLLSKENNQILSEMGYDGVIYYYNGKMNEIVVFKTNQIKKIK